ncbi:hypothetical protein GF325_13775 [Candidatus Bathyarchaeota archaeon]|nr:hypothetical protein [Candidatus Bathyarchaeota archaeon]
MFFQEITLIDFLKHVTSNSLITAIDAWYDTPFHLMGGEKRSMHVRDAIRQYRENNEIAIVSHLKSVDVNPIAYSPAMREMTLSETKKSMDFASSIQASHVTVHGGFNSFGKKFSRLDGRLLEQFLVELLEYKNDQGYKYEICLEHDSATKGCIRPCESYHFFSGLLEKVDGLNVTLDLAHVMKSSLVFEGSRYRDKRIDSSSFKEFISTWKKKIKVIHVSSPSEQCTHDRIDFSADHGFSTLIDTLVTTCEMDDIPIIFEYTMGATQVTQEDLSNLEEDMAVVARIVS